MAVVRWAADIVRGFFTVLVGMRVTLRHFLEKPVTMHYPAEREIPDEKDKRHWVMPEAFRGKLKADRECCLACMACTRACPVDCFTIEAGKKPDGKGKMAVEFKIDYSKCMYCGLCVYACPTGGLWHSHDFENSAYTREDLVTDWLDPANRTESPRKKAKQQPEAKPKAAAPAPAGEGKDTEGKKPEQPPSP